MDHRASRNRTLTCQSYRDELRKPTFAELIFNFTKEFEMNSDQAKGRIKEAGGKVQQEAGKVTGNLGQQAKGVAKQVVGKVQKTVGDARNEADKGR